MGRTKINIPKEEITEFCKKWNIKELALFGSVLSDYFDKDSDIDVLATFNAESKWSLFDLVRMKYELKEIFGRDVDLLSRRGVESSRNYIRRNAILESAEAVYEAG